MSRLLRSPRLCGFPTPLVSVTSVALGRTRWVLCARRPSTGTVCFPRSYMVLGRTTPRKISFGHLISRAHSACHGDVGLGHLAEACGRFSRGKGLFGDWGLTPPPQEWSTCRNCSDFPQGECPSPHVAVCPTAPCSRDSRTSVPCFGLEPRAARISPRLYRVTFSRRSHGWTPPRQPFLTDSSHLATCISGSPTSSGGLVAY